MSGGIIIQRRAAIKTVVTDPSIYDGLSSACKDRIDLICTKGLADWTDDEESFMASMPTVAVHC